MVGGSETGLAKTCPEPVKKGSWDPSWEVLEGSEPFWQVVASPRKASRELACIFTMYTQVVAGTCS